MRNTFPDFPFVFFTFWPFKAYTKIATTIKFEFIPFSIRDSTLTWSKNTFIVPSFKVTWQVYVPSSYFLTSYIVSSRSSAVGFRRTILFRSKVTPSGGPFASTVESLIQKNYNNPKSICNKESRHITNTPDSI